MQEEFAMPYVRLLYERELTQLITDMLMKNEIPVFVLLGVTYPWDEE